MTKAHAIIAGGGTAGHVVPGLAIASELVARGVPPEQVHYVGSARGIETRLVPEAGFPLTVLPGEGSSAADPGERPLGLCSACRHRRRYPTGTSSPTSCRCRPRWLRLGSVCDRGGAVACAHRRRRAERRAGRCQPVGRAVCEGLCRVLRGRRPAECNLDWQPGPLRGAGTCHPDPDRRASARRALGVPDDHVFSQSSEGRWAPGGSITQRRTPLPGGVIELR